MAKVEKSQNDNPRIGVFICHCGTNIAGVIDVEEAAEYAKKLKGVVFATDYSYMCSEPGQTTVKDTIEEHNLNRVVVAACSPRLHEPTFRKALQEAGLNPYLCEMVNIREHCTWVHIKDPKKAARKTNDLIRMGVARALTLMPQKKKKAKVKRNAMVIGAGIAGIQAALDLADQGFKTYLVEKEPTIGGNMARLDKTFPTMDCSSCILTPKMVDVSRHPNIKLLAYSEVKSVEGYIGNFSVKVEKKPSFVIEEECTACGLCVPPCPIESHNEFDLGLGIRKAIYVPFPQAVPLTYTIDSEHCVGCGMCKAVCELEAIDFNQKPEVLELDVGVIIVATGFDIFNATRKEEYGYGRYDNVLNGLEFERFLSASGPTGGKVLRPSDGSEPTSIGFIQCVGSRDEKTNKYCSRVCCMYAIKNARLYKEKHPETEIYIFYMDIRAFGKGYEEFYRTAQEEYDIKFVRGRPAEITEDPKTKNLRMVVEDSLLGKVIEVNLDLVVLSVGMEPPHDVEVIQKVLGLSKSADGFFLEAHPKLRPVDTLIDGIYLAGATQGPKDIPDSVAQGSAAASRASIPLSQGEIEIEPVVAFVDQDVCIGCRVCERVCDFGAVKVVDKKASVNEAICKGCGACAGGCPTGAIQVMHFLDSQIYPQIHAAFVEEFEE